MNLLRSFRQLVAGISGALLLISVSELHACACCSDPGEYRLKTNQPVGDYERTQLGGMKFAADAQLYLTDAGEDEVKGVGSVFQQNTVTAAVEPKQWRLIFKTEEGKTGVLTLPLPRTMTTFAADIHDEEEGKSPRLYKEWRFEGVAKGDGIFQAGFAAPARYSLIFQGRGNRCDNGADFNHWRLEVSGKKASYAFFGDLVAEDDDNPEP
jgi:hypothetical protein